MIPSSLNIPQLLPEILLFCLAIVILVADMLISLSKKKRLWDISFLGLLAILIVVSIPFTGSEAASGESFNGQAIIGGLTVFLRLIIVSALFATMIFSVDWLNDRPEKIGIYIFLVMISALGGLVVASAGNLLILLLGIEILSVPLYVLAGFHREDKEGQEASFKYFILGSFASAFLALGIALIYSSISTIDFAQIQKLGEVDGFRAEAPLIIGLVFIIATISFKGGLMPFYAWIPDVYRGSPDYVVGFMASVAKTSVFAALIRIGIAFLPSSHAALYAIIAMLFALTVILGNLMALWQSDVKRMLAYSSIAHAGYLLLGLLALNEHGLSAIVFYLLVYSFAAIGAFVVTGIVRKMRGGYTLDNFDGLWAYEPGLAFAMTLFLLTLAGIPPLAGFFSKLFLFNAAINGGFWKFVVLASITSLIGVYYYLRVIVRMYMKPAPVTQSEREERLPAFYTDTALFLSSILVIALGILPGRFYEIAHMFLRQLFL